MRFLPVSEKHSTRSFSHWKHKDMDVTAKTDRQIQNGPVTELFRSFDLVFCHKGETSWHRNHRVPTGAETPAATAASSLDRPAAISRQNRHRFSRCQTGGRPGEDNLRREDRSDFRLPVVINTSKIRVLRRPVESAQYCSHDYQKLLRQHGFRVSMSGTGNCYDNAAVETFFKTIKAELLWQRSWRTRRDTEIAIFEYINGFYNPRRRHSALGWKSPLAFERKAA